MMRSKARRKISAPCRGAVFAHGAPATRGARCRGPGVEDREGATVGGGTPLTPDVERGLPLGDETVEQGHRWRMVGGTPDSRRRPSTASGIGLRRATGSYPVTLSQLASDTLPPLITTTVGPGGEIRPAARGATPTAPPPPTRSPWGPRRG